MCAKRERPHIADPAWGVDLNGKAQRERAIG